jgi:hypothetical protein
MIDVEQLFGNTIGLLIVHVFAEFHGSCEMIESLLRTIYYIDPFRSFSLSVAIQLKMIDTVEVYMSYVAGQLCGVLSSSFDLFLTDSSDLVITLLSCVGSADSKNPIQPRGVAFYLLEILLNPPLPSAYNPLDK